MRVGRHAAFGLLALAAAGLLGCSGGDLPPSSPSTAPALPVAAPAATGRSIQPRASALARQSGPVGIETLQTVCEKKVGITAAPPYAGAPPHPLYGLQASQNATASVLSPILWNQPPADLQGALDLLRRGPNGQLAIAYDRIQLVACVLRTSSSPTGTVCDIGGRRVRLLRGNYRLTVLEARTGKVVRTTDLGAGTAGCPTFAFVDPVDPVVFTGFEGAQAYDALRPLLLARG